MRQDTILIIIILIRHHYVCYHRYLYSSSTVWFLNRWTSFFLHYLLSTNLPVRQYHCLLSSPCILDYVVQYFIFFLKNNWGNEGQGIELCSLNHCVMDWTVTVTMEYLLGCRGDGLGNFTMGFYYGMLDSSRCNNRHWDSSK